MKRRDFVKSAAIGSIVLGFKPELFGKKNRTPDLAIVKGDSPVQITKKAISLIGGMEQYVSKGDKVIVKPNIGWDRNPQQAACTNPEVVSSVIQLCQDAGAKEIIVMDNTCNPAKRTYVRSGIEEAAKNAGAKVLYPNKYRLRKMKIKGEWLKEWEVYTYFMEADKIINLPIAKTHSLSRLTMGMKNWLGAIGGSRNQLHQKINQAMVDLSAFFKPVLTVLDGYRILVRNGPQGGRLSDVKLHKTVVAGKDYVAVDTVGASFFNLTPNELPFLKIANEKGHGEINLEKLSIEKRTI
ncbi:MAG: DUF362 domain-containing protein [Candidatus Aminicenantaceae bacterium]